MGRRGIVVASALSAALWWAQPARAGLSAEVVDGVLTVTGGSGNDVIEVGCSGGDVVVNDRAPSTGRTACADVLRIVVRAQGGSDVVDLRAVLPADFTALRGTRVLGSSGYDTLYGSPFDDVLEGGDGNDTLWASAGLDDLDAGGGEDVLRAETRGDLTLTDGGLTTEEGTAALAAFEQASLRSLGRAVRFDLRGFRGRTFVTAGRGADVLLGGPGVSGLSGGPGGDRLIGGEGEDFLSGGDGADVLRGGPARDRLDGGPGRDDCDGGADVDFVAGCP